MPDNWKLAVGGAALASGVVAGALFSKFACYKDIPNIPTPKKWVRVGTLSGLIIYPIKSCMGVNVDEAFATTVGLKESEYFRDRVFMVVDERYVFQTQRTIPKMALIKALIDGKQLILTAPNVDPCVLNIPDSSPTNTKSCRIFDDHVAECLDCGDEIGKWLDNLLEPLMGKSGFRLVYHHTNKTQRAMTGLQKKFPTFVPSDKGTFQDQTSFMLISETSVDELNTQLETTKVSHRNFRPSILIKDAPEPFAEDFWGFVKIGNEGAVFKAAKPCTRCKLTTVNPDTGEFIPSGEPLSKLIKNPRSMGNDQVDALVKNQGILGLQLGLFSGDGQKLKVGDPVYAAVL